MEPMGPHKSLTLLKHTRYAGKTVGHLDRTEMSYMPAPEPDRRWFQRNLQCIFMVTFIVIVAGLILLDATSAPIKDSSPVYPTPGTAPSTRGENYTGVVGVNTTDAEAERNWRLQVFAGEARLGTTEDDDAADAEAPLEERPE